MTRLVEIKLNAPIGGNVGPILYLNANVGVISPDVTTVTELLAGLIVSVDENATQINVVSDDPCNILIELPVNFTKCHQVEVTGTATISYEDVYGIIQSPSYTNITVNICAKLGSVIASGTGSVVITPSSILCNSEIDCWEEFIMDANELDFLKLQIISTGKYAIEWSPGVYDIFNSGFGIRSHLYSTPYTGVVKIKAPSLSYITRLTITTNYLSQTLPTYLNLSGSEISKLTKINELDIGYSCNARVFANTSDFPSTLTKLRVYKGTVSGDINDLSSSILFDLEFYGDTDVYGDIKNLPPILDTLAIYGVNSLSGDIADLPNTLQSTLKNIQILGSNQITGDISSFSTFINLFNVRLEGLNTIYGDIIGISDLIKMRSFIVYGKNYLTGDLSSIVGWLILETFIVDNNNIYLIPGSVGNEITGDISNIPATVKAFILGKYNTVYGNISSLPLGITNFSVWQDSSSTGVITGNLSSITTRPLVNFFLLGPNNTVTGVINDLPSTLLSFTLYTDSTLSGNLYDLPTDIKIFTLNSANAGSIITYTPGRTWAPIMQTLDIYISAAPAITNINDLVIDLDNSTWTVITAPVTYGVRLKGTLTDPAAIAAKNNIDINTNILIYP